MLSLAKGWRTTHRQAQRAGGALAVLLVVVGGVFGRGAPPETPESAGTPEQARAAAHERWSARPFARYRLVLEEDGRACRQEVVVAAEQVVAVLANTCARPARTVSDLFAAVEQLQRQLTARAASVLTTRTGETLTAAHCMGACVCNRERTVLARYDPALGYPREISWRHQERAEWLTPVFWRTLWATHKLPACASPQSSGLTSRWTVKVSLTPLP